ncbi:hypothetical protein [Microbispora rosea]|uniref:hypothetical protein n=1 Tax=Microbispora rosea TaxID=58117 RepID=UPI0033F15676
MHDVYFAWSRIARASAPAASGTAEGSGGSGHARPEGRVEEKFVEFGEELLRGRVGFQQGASRSGIDEVAGAVRCSSPAAGRGE